MPNQNVDLAAFLGNNPYYANAVPQMTAQTTVPNFDNYEPPSYLTDGQIDAMGYGNYTRGLDQERFRAAPVQKVDLAAFLGNNPAYNQTPAAAQQPATDPRGTRNPKYDGMVWLPEAKLPADFYLPATPAPPNVTLGPPGMNYGNMNEQYFTTSPMGPEPPYNNPYVGIASLLGQ
jgi:hypothetical protein